MMLFHSNRVSYGSLSEFLGELVHIITSLLSEDHDLESIKVGGFFSLVESLHLLADFGGGPLGVKIESLGSLGKSAGSASSENWESQSGESKSLQWHDGSREFAKAINEHTHEVDEVNNHDQFAVILSIIDEANSTWFNEISKTL